MLYLLSVPLLVIALAIMTIIPFIRSRLRRYAVIRYGMILFVGLNVATLVFLGTTEMDADAVIMWRPFHGIFEPVPHCLLQYSVTHNSICPPKSNYLMDELTLRARMLPPFSRSCYIDNQEVCAEADQRIKEAGGQWTDFWKNSFYSVVACAGGVLVFGLIAPSQKKKKQSTLISLRA
jgi:hypothetical protein